MDIEKARKQLVSKRNDMIQRSRFSLTSIENKAVLYILSKVTPNDKPGKLYDFDCNEFYRLIKWSTDSYTDLKAMLTKISNRSWWIDLDEENEALVRWFNIVHMNKGTGSIKLSFHEDMFPFILDLQKQKELNGVFYTTYQLQNIALMKHQYSPRLYEILKSYQFNNQKWIFEIGTGSIYDLQLRLANSEIGTGKPILPANWSFYATFNRDVLKPAQMEINKYTDIKIEYEASKIDLKGVKHRKYCVVKFYMVGKTKMEKDTTEKMIDEEYRQIEESDIYHQFSIEEMFFKNHTEVLQKENEIEEISAIEKEELKLEERIEKSNYKVLTSMLNEFTDKQIESLYTAATKQIEPGKIKFEMRELWIVDYITHYYDLVKATKDEIKTTAYKRLLDLVRKDYEKFADQITEYDKVDEVELENKSDPDELTFEEASRQLLKLQEYFDKLKKKDGE